MSSQAYVSKRSRARLAVRLAIGDTVIEHLGFDELSAAEIVVRVGGRLGEPWATPDHRGIMFRVTANSLSKVLRMDDRFECQETRSTIYQPAWRVFAADSRPWMYRPYGPLLPSGVVNNWLDPIVEHLRVVGPSTTREIARALGGDFTIVPFSHLGRLLGLDPRFHKDGMAEYPYDTSFLWGVID